MQQRVTSHALIGLLVFVTLYAPTVLGQQADTTERYFPETGYRVTGVFLAYWEQNGALPVFGYPLSEQRVENGRTIQYFERARFELNPDQSRPAYRVLLGRVGAELFAQQPRGPEEQAPSPLGECAYIAAINVVCDQEPGRGFLSYWRSHGLAFDGQAGFSFAESLALFGYPITTAYLYTDANGTRVVQWFERARFEWYPASPEPYIVLLGRLGAERLEQP
jgi:hypothetical protein